MLAITYFGYAEILAPTSVCAVVLIRKTQTKTAVGAISDRQRLQQLSIKAIKDCIQVIQSLIFAKFSAYVAAPYPVLPCYYVSLSRIGSPTE